MMSALCRAACLRALSLSRGPLPRTAHLRQMSASSVPGSSGQSKIYYLFVAVAASGGGFYVYRTLSRDRARFQERRAYLESNAQEWTPKPWPPKADGEDAETSEAAEVSEEVEEAVTLGAVAVNVEEVVAQKESPMELEHQEDGPPVGIISSVADQEVTPQEKSNLVEEAHVQEILEAELSSAIEEKLASAEEERTPTEDLSELSFQKPETDAEASIQFSKESQDSKQ